MLFCITGTSAVTKPRFNDEIYASRRRQIRKTSSQQSDVANVKRTKRNYIYFKHNILGCIDLMTIYYQLNLQSIFFTTIHHPEPLFDL